jgi:hypothetical protein
VTGILRSRQREEQRSNSSNMKDVPV